VDNVVRLPLQSNGGEFTLASLKPKCWQTEMEFYFPLRFITSDNMKDFLSEWGGGENDGADLHRLWAAMKFRPVEGMVRGFMDMVFEHGGKYYLVDWKSNHLGSRPEDYSRERMKEEMTRKRYQLQYLLYTVALNRYLSKRVEGYDYHERFGGVLYFFLRGVRRELGEGFGLFRDLPSAEMIEDLTERLIRSGG
jgi:exodeoxyribonuclease V beta subunit